MKNSRPAVFDTARAYIRRRWAPVPIPPRKKKPVLKGWPDLRVKEAEVEKYFHAGENIGLILGEASGWLVDVDLDCREARDLADQFLPSTPTVTGRPSTPRSHRWYIAKDAKTEKHTDPKTRKMIVELRSTGGQTVVGPSVHPNGETYDVLTGDPAIVAAPMLKACVAALAKEVIRLRYGDVLPERKPTISQPRNDCDEVDIERRAIAYLNKMPSAISGSGGHAATYAAATVLVHGFGIKPERAIDLLKLNYNPRCDPPWSNKELEHKVNDAANKPHEQPFGWLRDAERNVFDETKNEPVNISALLDQVDTRSKPQQRSSRFADPGPFPRHLLKVPGFIGDVMAYNLSTAFKPQPILALGAALALLGTLTGRKITDQQGTRTNVYCLGVCESGGGKERARQVNKDILFQAGLDHLVGPEGIASHAGLVAAVEKQPSLLMQLDEIGRMIKTLSDPSRAPHLYHIATVLMRMFTSSNSTYISDAYADVKRNRRIYQPHACLYGTTVPQSLYEGLSSDNLADGFYSRMMAFESDENDPEPQDVVVGDVPKPLIKIARFWGDFNPGGNLSERNPQPLVVECTPQARQQLVTLEKAARKERRARDESVLSLWTRTTEKARKLALLYACSVSCESPIIDDKAARWATVLSEYLTRKMICAAAEWVSENPFEAKLKRLYRDIRAAGTEGLTRSQLCRKTKHLNKKDRLELMDRLLELDDVREVREPTGGAPRIRYTAF